MELAKGFIPLPKTNKKESLLENGEPYYFELNHSDLETLDDKSRWQQLLKAAGGAMALEAQWLWRPNGFGTP
jgi:diketogulonate reductase-like aldo/keto reductase